MSIAIHVELNVLFFLILCRIAYQSIKNVNQQMTRVLFRNVVYGCMSALLLDSVWVLIDGKMFPGANALNWAVNALYLSMGVVIGCTWYLYVLESLGFRLTRAWTVLVMLPGAVSTALNLISIKTGWIFYIDSANVYFRGPLFWLQEAMALGTLFASLIHIIVRLINRDGRVPRSVVTKLLGFYIIPVIGTLAAMPFTGMPGTWTCASVSIVLFYLDNQDSEIIRDSLTGLNNRKTLPKVFAEYLRQQNAGARLYLFMIDLDNFKGINDTLGHPMGDQALIEAANLFMRSVDGLRAIAARVGGDEFLIMGFLKDDQEAEALRNRITQNFVQFNLQKKPPYVLAASIGCRAYEQGQTLDQFMKAADEELYRVKQAKRGVSG